MLTTTIRTGVPIQHWAQCIAEITAGGFAADDVQDYMFENPISLESLAPYTFFSSKSYTRNLIFKTDVLECLVLCWDIGQSTCVHNHDQKTGWMYVADGRLFVQNYRLAERDMTWLKRKPEITLDLVLIGAVFAVTSKENVGTFGSYVIAARKPDGSFVDVGDVAGLDRARDLEIQREIMRDGLATGKRIERASASGVRSGMELRPSIVVTVKFEGIARDTVTGVLALRGPKLAQIRADKPASEADSVRSIEELYLRQRVG